MKRRQTRKATGSYVDYILILEYLSGPVLRRRTCTR